MLRFRGSRRFLRLSTSPPIPEQHHRLFIQVTWSLDFGLPAMNWHRLRDGLVGEQGLALAGASLITSSQLSCALSETTARCSGSNRMFSSLNSPLTMKGCRPFLAGMCYATSESRWTLAPALCSWMNDAWVQTGCTGCVSQLTWLRWSQRNANLQAKRGVIERDDAPQAAYGASSFIETLVACVPAGDGAAEVTPAARIGRAARGSRPGLRAWRARTHRPGRWVPR